MAEFEEPDDGALADFGPFALHESQLEIAISCLDNQAYDAALLARKNTAAVADWSGLASVASKSLANVFKAAQW